VRPSAQLEPMDMFFSSCATEKAAMQEISRTRAILEKRLVMPANVWHQETRDQLPRDEFARFVEGSRDDLSKGYARVYRRGSCRKFCVES